MCGSDIADGSSLGVGFLNPQANRNVICYILYNGKEKDIKIREILNLSCFCLKLFCYEREQNGMRMLLLLIVAGMVPVKLIKFFVVPSL